MALSFDYIDELPAGISEAQLATISTAIGTAFPPLERASTIAELQFISTDEMRALNKTYRELDEPTDVLSFPTLYEGLAFFDTFQEDGTALIGSIIVCPEKVALYGETLPEVIVHSLIHLAGFDHETDLEQWYSEEARCIAACAALNLSIRGIRQLI